MINKYYQQELEDLWSNAQALSESNPDTVKYLGRKSNDPDSQRIIEAAALLSASLKKTLDEEHQEYQQGFLQALAPDAPLALPAITLVSLGNLANDLNSPLMLEKGLVTTVIDTDDELMQLYLAQSVTLLGLNFKAERTLNGQLSFELSGDLASLLLHPLSFQMNNLSNNNEQNVLFYQLNQALDSIQLHALDHSETITTNVSKRCLSANNLASKGPLNPMSHALSSMWLSEVYLQPALLTGMQLDLADALSGMDLSQIKTLNIVFDFNQPLSVQPDISINNAVMLGLNQHISMPFERKEGTTLYPLELADKDINSDYLFQINSVIEKDSLTGEERRYQNLAEQLISPSHAAYQVVKDQSALQLRLQTLDTAAKGLINTQLTLVNDLLSKQLMAYDEVMVEGKPARIISNTSVVIPPKTEQAQLWAYHYSLMNRHDSLIKLENLDSLLRQLIPKAEDQASNNKVWLRKIAAIQDISSSDEQVRIRTAIVFGEKVQLKIDIRAFIDHSDAYVFCHLIWLLLRSRLPVNAFLSLHVVDHHQNPLFQFKAHSGSQVLL